MTSKYTFGKPVDMRFEDALHRVERPVCAADRVYLEVVRPAA
jgi:hypothetical protein